MLPVRDQDRKSKEIGMPSVNQAVIAGVRRHAGGGEIEARQIVSEISPGLDKIKN
jgi:hypothetical protein